jgi:hypothetical protein
MRGKFGSVWEVIMQIRLTASLSALMWSSIATSAPPQLLQPVDKWQLDFGDTRCTAARSYGDAASPVVLVIIPSLNGAYYKVMISTPRAGPSFAKESRGTVDFGRGAIASELLYYGKSGVKQSVYQFMLTAADIAQAEAATAVTVTTVTVDRATFGFSLSDVPALLAGLRSCNADLNQYWNIGGKTGTITAGAPVADIRTLLTAKDYPTEAQWLKPRASSRYQLLIDEKGAVAACDVLSPSGAQVLDSTGCQVIAGRTKFRPATDSSGKAVRSAWTTPPLVWTSGVESALDSGCAKLSSDGRTLVNMCGRSDSPRIPTLFTAPPPPPPPPPPPK